MVGPADDTKLSAFRNMCFSTPPHFGNRGAASVSATHCLNSLAVFSWFSTSFSLISMADYLNLSSLSGVIENPSLEKCWMSCLHPVHLSISTATPDGIVAMIFLGLVACMIHWLRLNCIWPDGTNNAIKFFNDLGTHFSPSTISSTLEWSYLL